jgi:purine nucleosidase
MLHLVIDTDTASDDAVALIMALMHPDVCVEAITVVAGNVPLPAAVNNALLTVERCVGAGRPSSVPVYVGLDGPRDRPLETAQYVHGEDGMGDIGLPLATTEPAGLDAVEQLLSLPLQTGTPLTLVTLGPLTNVAAALERDPLLLTRYQHTVMMAGAPDLVGNVNAHGEFNVWCDPEAADAVCAAPGRKTLVGWNISRQYAVMTPHDQAHLRTLGPLGEFVHTINRVVDEYARSTGLEGYDLPDPITMAIAIDPTMVTETSQEAILITIDGTDDRGASHPARHSSRPTMAVVWGADEAAFKRQLFAACSVAINDGQRG